MHDATVEFPVGLVPYLPRQLSCECEDLLRLMANTLADAALALSLYETKHISTEGWSRKQVMRLPFLYAKTFLFELDTLMQALEALAQVQGGPAAIAQIRDELRAALPKLREVRNSAHHAEDRVRRRGPNGKQIDPKPVDIPGMRVAKGMCLGNLIYDEYCYTTASGEHACVKVTAASLSAAKRAVEQARDAFVWEDSYAKASDAEDDT